MSRRCEELIEPGNPDNSQSVILELVGPDRRVLDVGCGSGYLARALARQGCTVSGIDDDAEAAEKAREDLAALVVADLDDLDLIAAFTPASFDVVVVGDVLARLADPRSLLRQARRLLAPGGQLVVSVHNVAHGDVAMALLCGAWEYRPAGLLAETSRRLFTGASLRSLLIATGFLPLETRRVGKPLFATEVGVRPDQVAATVLEQVRRSAENETYQFVVRAVPDDVDGQLARLAGRDHDLSEQVYALTGRLGRLEAELAARETELSTTADRLALAEAERDIRAAEAERADRELRTLRATRTLRYARRLREAYGRVRALR